MSEAWDVLERGLARAPVVVTPSPRELDVLRCLSYGMTQNMAAEALGIGRETVNEHLDRARVKLAAKNAAHAVAQAIRHGFIT